MSDTVYDCPDYPLLLILSGPSGVGKDTVARLIIERRPDSFYFVVTATTRAPRPDEMNRKLPKMTDLAEAATAEA